MSPKNRDSLRQDPFATPPNPFKTPPDASSSKGSITLPHRTKPSKNAAIAPPLASKASKSRIRASDGENNSLLVPSTAASTQPPAKSPSWDYVPPEYIIGTIRDIGALFKEQIKIQEGVIKIRQIIHTDRKDARKHMKSILRRHQSLLDEMTAEYDKIDTIEPQAYNNSIQLLQEMFKGLQSMEEKMASKEAKLADLEDNMTLLFSQIKRQITFINATQENDDEDDSESKSGESDDVEQCDSSDGSGESEDDGGKKVIKKGKAKENLNEKFGPPLRPLVPAPELPTPEKASEAFYRQMDSGVGPFQFKKRSTWNGESA